MYTLYTDQSELFEANISVSGTSLSETSCRLIIETETITILFSGKVTSDGRCEIPIKALSKYLSEGSTGTVRLEVIAENTYFVPWESPFEVKTNKKITVEVKSNKITPLLVEATPIIKTSPPSSHVLNVFNLIRKNYGSRKTGSEPRLLKLLSDIDTYTKKHNMTTEVLSSTVDGAFKLLTESKNRK